jgi:hypothetical protein
MNKLYFLIKTNDLMYKLPSFKEYFGIYGWTVIGINPSDYQFFPRFDIHYYELDESLVKGFKNFGNAKSTVSVSIFDEDEDLDFDDYEVKRDKVKIQITQERYDSIMKAMKLFAKVLLEEEFDKRFEKLRYTGCKLEMQTWEEQVKEILKFNDQQETPLLSAIATAKGIELSELVLSIETKLVEYKQKVQTLYTDLIKLKTEFSNCVIIEELNILYTKYFGQQFYISPEYRTEHSETFNENGEYKFTVPITYNF